MKKVLGILCALMLTALSLLSASAYDKAYQKGDADMNGRITIDDATLIQRYVAELVACDGFWPLFTADADNNGVAFEDLPDDWTCPMCGVGKDQFEQA